MAAHVEVSGFQSPVISVKHSSHVRSVTRDDRSERGITVAFTNLDTWRAAVDDWSQHPDGIYIIAYAGGCGPGIDSGERSFHLVHAFTSNQPDRTVPCEMNTFPIHEAVHVKKAVTIRMPQEGRSRTESSRRHDVDSDLSHDADLDFGSDFLQGPQKVSDDDWNARGAKLNDLATADSHSIWTRSST
ncbi:hypothetical protein DFH09DRAFT_1333596 [Mycena vulgaris]|nr:hypothetical protein DFH09DRAFT_1333596 [Mycena vulgaris]